MEKTGAAASVPELICGQLSSCGLNVPFLPDTWREGCACVSMSGGITVLGRYVDGSFSGGLQFDVRVRRSRASHICAGGLSAAEFFAALDRAVRDIAPEPACGLSDIHIEPQSSFISAPHKSQTLEDGTVEYRAGYTLRFKAAPGLL